MKNNDMQARSLTDRRAFLRRCGRGIMGALALAAAGRFRRRISLAGAACCNQGVCAGCREYRVCRLPPALSRRACKGDEIS